MEPALDIGVNEGERIRNRMNGLGVVNDLHGVFDDLRTRGDVHDGGLPTLFGQPDFTFFPGFEDAPRYTVIGYDWAQHVFRRHETFSSELFSATAAAWGPNLLMMDEPEHARYRALAQPAFALKTMQRWQDRWLAPTVDRLLGRHEGSERADLYMELCARFPAHTIGAALGISEDETAQVHDWIIRTAVNMPAEEREAAGAGLVDFLAPIIADRRASPGDDVVSLLATSELVAEDGSTHRLGDAEIMGFCGLLLIAGTGTSYRATGILLLALLSRPELLDQVKADRSLVPRCVEEVLRWDPRSPPSPGSSPRTRWSTGSPSPGAPWSTWPSAQPTGIPHGGTTPTGTTPTVSRSSTWASGGGPTSAWATSWPAWRWPPRSPRCSTASPGWGSTPRWTNPT
jgi:cytochrome P450